jgi:hypothetical protein
LYDDGDFSVSTLLFGLTFAGFLPAAGSAVTGRFRSGRRGGRVGRTGADDNEPIVDIAVAGRATPEKVDGFIGVADGSAEPGRSGRTFPFILARFCAAIVSRIDGFGGSEFVLLDKGKLFTPGGGIAASGSL